MLTCFGYVLWLKLYIHILLTSRGPGGGGVPFICYNEKKKYIDRNTLFEINPFVDLIITRLAFFVFVYWLYTSLYFEYKLFDRVVDIWGICSCIWFNFSFSFFLWMDLLFKYLFEMWVMYLKQLLYNYKIVFRELFWKELFFSLTNLLKI